jgi:predicted nucleotide-binding protein (sugar kinase/HSP70/actin superfamily)
MIIETLYNMAEKLRIGIPRALFYYNYFPLYKIFFERLDAEVVLSDRTNKAILNLGLKSSINELCIPIKLLYGHVKNLQGKKVDYIFLPYIIAVDSVSYICPKLIAAPDLIKVNFDETKLLTFDIDMNSFYSSALSSLSEVSMKLSINPIKILSAYNEAKLAQKRFENYIEKGFLFEEALALIEYSEKSKKVKDAIWKKSHAEKFQKESTGRKYGLEWATVLEDHLENKKTMEDRKTIAIIGHSYIYNDDYISSSLIKKLEARNINVLTSDMVSRNIIKKKISAFEKIPHWFLGNRVLGSAIYFSEKKNIDGIIYITPFGCSSDSLIKECIDAKVVGKKPFMTITVDEHSGDAGQNTRIEAFLDMLDRRKQKERTNVKLPFRIMGK